MVCGQGFFELKSQTFVFSGLIILGMFRYKLHCNPSFCSLSAFNHRGLLGSAST